MAASNRNGNIVMFVLFVLATYFGYVFIPAFSDNVSLKTYAREYIVSTKRNMDEERARREFINNAANMGIKLTEQNFQLEGENNNFRVKVHYTRDVEFPFIEKKKTLKFRWVVTMKFRS